MSKHAKYGIENYREELKFDYKVKQKCERCDLEFFALTRPQYNVKGDIIIPKDASWLCTSCHAVRD